MKKRSQNLIKRNARLREFYEELWNSRPRVSQVSGKPLFEYMKPYCFSHILSKGSEPRAIFDSENVVFMTPDEHRLWEDGKRDGMQEIVELKERLKIKYNNHDN
jgi:hypothetical protein